MNKIIFPLKQGMQGAAVADLQNALQRFLDRGVLLSSDEAAPRELSDALERERIDQKYGSGTSKLVSLFQQARALQSTGEVEEPTAKALNELLQRFGLLDMPRANGNGSHIVTGELRRQDGLPLRGVRMRAMQEMDGAAIRMGEDTTDAQGHYTIRYELLPGVDGIDLRVAAVREDGELLQSSELTHNPKPLEIIDLTVSLDRKPVEQRRIEGRVLLEHGLPASQLKLRLYRLDFGGKATMLDETSTLTGGEYALAYDPAGKAASLELRAVSAAGEEMKLSEPLNDRSTESREGVNLVGPATLQPLAPEYRRLAGDLAAHLGEIGQLASARENEERQDLTVLNRATGWDARLIAIAASTERLSSDPDVHLPREWLYGLLRAGLPSDKLALAQVEPDAAEMALKAVRDARIVEFSDAQIAEFKTQFASFATKVRLDVPAPGSHATYGKLLQASGLSAEVQDKFAPVYLKHRGRGAALWDEARKAGLDDAQVRKLQLQGKLAYLAGNSEGMTSRLMQKQIRDPAELVEQDFHRTQAWVTEILAQAGVPADRRENLNEADKKKLAPEIPSSYSAEDVEERLAAYAEDMARKVRRSYPTQVLTRQVESGEIKLPVPREDTVKLLKNAAGQGFRLGETPVQAFLTSHQGVRADMTDAEFETAGRQLNTLHRVYQITPSNDAMPVLMELDMTSAYDVMAYSEAEFTALYSRKYFDLHGKQPAPSEPRLVYRKATQVSSVTYNLFTIARKMDSEPLVAGLSADIRVRDDVRQELVKQFPTMERLFGSMDFCECEHCRSVLSPAAYLVDLLQFIDPEPEVWANFLAGWKLTHTQDYPHPKPYDVLMARRPDLPHIALTCENTHTALPYIDIVNEILEYYVAKGALDEGAAHDTGSATTAELLAEPQNVIGEAYMAVSEARYPLSLPFDLGTETVRQFCDFFETPLTRLIEVFGPDDIELFSPAPAPDRFTLFMESLGLSRPELALFIDPDPLAKWHELYGYEAPADATIEAVDAETGQRTDLNSAKTLARRLGVTYKELAEILQTGFVNPRLPGLALLYKLGVSIHDARLYLTHKALLTQDPAALSLDDQKLRLEAQAFAQKLARLQAALPASPPVDIDAAVQAIPFDAVLVLSDTSAGGNFDSTTLRYADGEPADKIAFLRINLFVRLWRKLGWTIEETGRALDAFVPAGAPFEEDSLAQQPLKTALVYLAHLKALDQKLGLGKNARVKLLALWSDLPVTGNNPLYAQLFLTRSMLKSDAVFDHPLGQYLSGAGNLIEHLPAVQGALTLTADEIGRILEETGQSTASAPLSLANLSQLYRYRLLAKGLKLPVRDLIALKQLSGLDPFRRLHPQPLADTPPSGVEPAKKAIELDYPYSQTLRFVQVAEEVQESGLTVEQLEYLLRHRFEPAGKFRTDTGVTLALLKTLAEGIRAIRGEHATPADSDAVSEELLRQKLGLVLLPGVVARLLAMMNRTGFSGGTGSDREFFDDQLRKHAVRVADDAGFLDEADFDSLFAPLQPLLEIPSTDSDQEIEAKQVANDKIHGGNLAQLQRRRNRVAQAFLPFLRQRLIRQFIIQALTAHTGADAALVESLLTDERLAAGPLLKAFAASGEGDVGAGFFGASGRLLDAANTRFDGYLEVPAPGAYRFHVVLDKKNAKAKLRFEHLRDPVLLDATAPDDNAVVSGPGEFVELKPGVPYRFTLELAQLGSGSAQLLVQGETMPKSGISQLTLHRLEAFEQAERALVLLAKLLQLAQGLGLNEREVRYLLTHEEAFERVEPAAADTAGRSLSKLPTQPADDTPERAQALFGRFLRWAAYARLKGELAGGSDELISVFEANEAADADRLDQKVYPLIAKLTRRSEAMVKATAETLVATPAKRTFESERPLQRLWQALQLAERFGAPVSSLAKWAGLANAAASFEQRFEIARDLRETLKSRLEPQAWQRLAQPIFDRLRQRQRDALAAFVMHKRKFASLERLYEEFLIDTGMEPVVETSRIRLAISSLQLFIQRSLLNMEREVNPSVINARHWDSTKRYRAWEAKRKIFLFPENWLEPEFRDDKTHLFTELEGALLQGDVSSDLAEDAFLEYLKNLDELARLDIVAMHMEDGAPEARVLHVIGRTYGKPHKHFYRRYARQMWTPWEPVTADVQGDHLVPMVWRDRLYLFWVTFMDKPVRNPEYGHDTKNKTLAQVELSKVSGDLNAARHKKQLDVQLHWSEYLEGEWSTPQASGFVPVTRPLSVPSGKHHGALAENRFDLVASEAALNAIMQVDLGLVVDDPFDYGSVFIHVSKEPSSGTGEQRGVYIHLRGGGVNQAFYVAGRNAAPESAIASGAPANPLSSARVPSATRYGGSQALTVEFRRHIITEDGQPPVDTVEAKSILQQCGAYTLLPCDSITSLVTVASPSANPNISAETQSAIDRGLPEIASLMRPVFFQDKAHTFLVEPSVTERTLEEWQDWVTPTPQPEPGWGHAHWWKDFAVVAEVPRMSPAPGPTDPGTGFRADPGSLLQPQRRADWLVNSGTALTFDGVLIGPAGKQAMESVSAGNALNIVGANGFNAALARNLDAQRRMS